MEKISIINTNNIKLMQNNIDEEIKFKQYEKNRKINLKNKKIIIFTCPSFLIEKIRQQNNNIIIITKFDDVHSPDEMTYKRLTSSIFNSDYIITYYPIFLYKIYDEKFLKNTKILGTSHTCSSIFFKKNINDNPINKIFYYGASTTNYKLRSIFINKFKNNKNIYFFSHQGYCNDYTQKTSDELYKYFASYTSCACPPLKPGDKHQSCEFQTQQHDYYLLRKIFEIMGSGVLLLLDDHAILKQLNELGIYRDVHYVYFDTEKSNNDTINNLCTNYKKYDIIRENGRKLIENKFLSIYFKNEIKDFCLSLLNDENKNLNTKKYTICDNLLLQNYGNINWNFIEEDEIKNYKDVIITDNYLKYSIYNKYNYCWLLKSVEISYSINIKIQNFIDTYKKILTYRKDILDKYKNSIFIPAGISSIKDIYIYPKNKLLSMIYSNKYITSGHKLNLEIVSEIKNINCDMFENFLENKLDGLRDYQFSIVIENTKIDYYFTEKIIDCFLTGVIPIYYGCPSIDKFFDDRGIITFSTKKELLEILEYLSDDMYIERIEYIKINFEKAKEYIDLNNFIYNIYN